MYYRIPALELSLSVPLVLLLQAVFRRAGARVWFMTSCCCLVEFGFSCFNHASIESWFVWFGPWYSTHHTRGSTLSQKNSVLTHLQTSDFWKALVWESPQHQWVPFLTICGGELGHWTNWVETCYSNSGTPSRLLIQWHWLATEPTSMLALCLLGGVNPGHPPDDPSNALLFEGIHICSFYVQTSIL